MRRPKEQPEQVAQPKWWQSPWYAGLTLLLAVIGVGWGIYSYVSSSEQKVPVYSVENTSLVSLSRRSVRDLTLLYHGKPVPQVTSTNIRIWNAGRKTIDAADVSRTDRLRIVLPKGADVLAIEDIKSTGPNAMPNPAQNGRFVLLNFEFLDQNDGCIVQILHTADTAARWKVTGRIKGARAISCVDADSPTKKAGRMLSVLKWELLIVILCFFLILTKLNGWGKATLQMSLTLTFFAILTAFLILLSFLLTSVSTCQIPTALR